jgi:hypothetical protein
MTIERMLTVQAADKGGMTLDELGAFVAAAMRAQVPGDTVVKVAASMRMTIRKIEVTG